METRIPQISQRVREELGDWVALIDDDNQEFENRIMVEFVHEGQHYLVLAPEGTKEADEWWYATAALQADGEWAIESVEDEDELERVDEWVDEWMFEQSQK